MKKKRLDLAGFQAGVHTVTEETPPSAPVPVAEQSKPVHKSVYISPAILDQLDLLAIHERPAPGRKKKFNTLILEGLDLLLKDRGLPSIAELTR